MSESSSDELVSQKQCQVDIGLLQYSIASGRSCAIFSRQDSADETSSVDEVADYFKRLDVETPPSSPAASVPEPEPVPVSVKLPVIFETESESTASKKPEPVSAPRRSSRAAKSAQK